MRRPNTVLLVGVLMIALTPLLWWLLTPLWPAAATALRPLWAALTAILVDVGWFSVVGWLIGGWGAHLYLQRARRPRTLTHTHQTATAFTAAAAADTREANARVLRTLAAQGIIVPGFTATGAAPAESGARAVTLDRSTTLLIFLRGQGDAGATDAALYASTGIRRVARMRTLWQLQRAGFVSSTGKPKTYCITTSGAAHIARF